MQYIDLSHKIESGIPVYPGDAEVSLVQVKNLLEDGYTAYAFASNLHAGTHIDCPLHLLQSPNTVDVYPLERFAGRGCLLDVCREKEIEYKAAYEDRVKKGDIVLLYTGTDAGYDSEAYYNHHPVVTEKLAKFFVAKEIKMLGMDMPSPDFFPFEIHKRLLGEGIFILENLTKLEELLPIEAFEVFAQPLKICAEASLTRAFARYVP